MLREIMTFATTHDAIKAEDLLRKCSLQVTVIPIPTYITADCGIALRFAASDRERVQEALLDAVAYSAIHTEER